MQAGRKRYLIDIIVETICSCRDDPGENVQLQVLKALLTVVSSNTCQTHGESLLLAVRACYHIYLVSKNPVNRSTAKASLTQILSIVFQRMEAEESRLEGKPPPPALPGTSVPGVDLPGVSAGAGAGAGAGAAAGAGTAPGGGQTPLGEGPVAGSDAYLSPVAPGAAPEALPRPLSCDGGAPPDSPRPVPMEGAGTEEAVEGLGHAGTPPPTTAPPGMLLCVSFVCVANLCARGRACACMWRSVGVHECVHLDVCTSCLLCACMRRSVCVHGRVWVYLCLPICVSLSGRPGVSACLSRCVSVCLCVCVLVCLWICISLYACECVGVCFPFAFSVGYACQ